jgi:hypothetical protein
MEAALQFPNITTERENRLQALIEDGRVHHILDTMPVISARILRRILAVGIITPSILYDVNFSIPPEEVERFQFIRMIQIATDLDAVVDEVITEVELGLDKGELP